MKQRPRKRLAAAMRLAGLYLMEGLAQMAWMTYAADPQVFSAGRPAPPDRSDPVPKPAMRAYRVDEYVIWLEDSGDGR